MNLEQNLLKLEQIADKLEKGEVSLDESLKLFSEGAELAESCLKQLSEGKGKLTQIKETLDKITEENFDADDEI